MSDEEETVTVSVSILATAVHAGLQDGITTGTNCYVNYTAFVDESSLQFSACELPVLRGHT